MKCFTNSFKCSGPANSSEVKAILFAVLSCVLFIALLTAAHGPGTRKQKRVTTIQSYPGPPPAAPVRIEEPPPPLDLNARFRSVPSNFRGIDFATRSYGTYRLPNGSSRDLVLIDGQFREFGESQHWFDLNDVFYTDLTGDGKPEAIVMLTHLECGRMCDGGKDLVYVYSQNHPVQEILQYESGSAIEGCSLKALTVENKKLTLDLYGKCPLPSGILGDFVRLETYELTRVEFFFNGKRLVPKKKTVLTLRNDGESNEGAVNTGRLSHGVNVRINDDTPPDPYKF